MDLEQTEELLALCLEEYHTLRARGESPQLSTFRQQLGSAYGEFRELISAESVIDEAMLPVPDVGLPMTWGAYTLLRELGRGGAGVVYEAVYRKLGRTVAVKILRTGIDTDDTARQRFQREAQALAQVRHDNIVEIYEFGDVAGQPFYAMGLVKGTSLAQMMREGAYPDPKDACRGMAGIADALHALHEAGIVHRDVKPGNIIVREDGQFILADFGLARTAMAATMTRTGDALGTPLYMSPEQMLGKRGAIDRRTDVYGAGATLYQLLARRPPFKGEDLHVLIRLILTQRPESPRSVRPDLPAGCSAITMKCLEKETSDRYETAAELAGDLRAFAGGGRVTGRPLTPLQRGVRWLQRRPVMSAAAAVLLAVAGWFALRPPPPPIPATLSVRVFPPIEAEGRLDDAYWMAMPLRGHKLPVGRTHVLQVRATAGGFGTIEKSFTPAANQELEWVLQMPVVDPNHPAVRAAFFKLAAIDPVQGVEAPDQGMRTRAVDGAPLLELGLPRGDVRLADLGGWELQVGMRFPYAFPQGGFIEFRRDDEVLGQVAVASMPDSVDVRGPVPKAVLEKLRTGDDVIWGFRGADQSKLAVSAAFHVVEADLDLRLQRIDERLSPMDPGRLRDELRASLRTSLFLNQQLSTAAYREVQSAVDGDADSLYLLNLQRIALEGLFPDPVQRHKSTLWMDYVARWASKPEAERKAFLSAAEAR